MRRLLLAALLSSSCLSAPVYAQDADIRLPDMVITATRVPTLIERIPAGVTIITRTMIEQRGYATLAEAMSAVPGARLVQSGGPGGNASLFLRGTNSNHVLVLRDGIPITDPSDPGGAFNFGVDTLADVDRIEVVRGPMSALYGSGAIGGVVNLITKRGAGKPVQTAELGFGWPRALRGSVGASGSQGMFDYRLGVATQAERGFDTTPQRQAVYTGARNPYLANTGNLEFGITPIDGTRAFLAVRARSAQFNIDSLGFPGYDARLYTGSDDVFHGRAGVTSRLFDDRWETSLIVGQLVSNRHYYQPLEAADPNFTSSNSRFSGRQTTVQWENTLHVPDWGMARDTAILFGYQHNATTSRADLTADFGGFAYQNSVRAASRQNAGHIGVQTTLGQRLTLTADARQEQGSYGGGAFTWRTGGVLAVPEAWSRLKASVGTGFRAPSLFDLFGIDTSGYVGNRNLRPERSIGWEAGWAIDLPAFGRRDFATLDVTYFENTLRDMIATVFNASFTAATSQNVNRAKIRGAEIALTARPFSWAEGSLAYTWTDARNRADNTRLLRRPVDQVSANLRLTPLPGLTIVPELVYTGSFQDFIIDDGGFQGGVGRAKPGVIFNLNINYAITPTLTGFVEGRNIGGSRFEPTNGFQTPGARVLAGLRARF
ncbi:MAG: TonB-dependent receptor [Acetobacteraceae bacterium]|nr:TonB-dependent receptor [Acetobacteraceae bacterium]